MGSADSDVVQPAVVAEGEFAVVVDHIAAYPGLRCEPSRVLCRSHVGLRLTAVSSVVVLLVLGWGEHPK